MKLSNITRILLLTMLTATLSCKRYNDEFYGPGLGVAPDDFSTNGLSVSDNTADFSAGTIHFTCDMSATVRWTLTLTGQTSGAIKKITGLSKTIDASNASWDGSTDTTRLFKRTETVKAELTVLGWDGSESTTLTITTEKNHGYIVGTFENITVNQMSANWQDPTPPLGSGYWWYFSFDANEKDLVDKSADPLAPQGTHVLQMKGHDANTSYYIGQVGLSAPSGVFNFGTPNPDNTYFNFYAKGLGTAASNDVKLVVQVFEDDNGSNTIQYDGNEDKYTSTVSLKYDGWKLHRLKYSDFVLETPSSPYKNYNPEKIANIGFFFGANTSAALSASNVLEVNIDFFTVTTDGPMIP